MTDSLAVTHDMSGDNARAFNAGCDARIAGQPEASPYPTSSEPHRQWLQGWRHADRNWAAEAKWPVRMLPMVLAEAS